MTIFHKDGNIHKNSDGLSRWELSNNIDNPAYVPEEASPQIPIQGISATDLNTTFFEGVRRSYTQDKNCSILCQLLIKDCIDNSLIHALDEAWKKSYYGGIFHLEDVNGKASRLKGMLEKSRKKEVRCMEDSISDAKDQWDKSHATPDFKVGDLVPISTTNFNKIKQCKQIKEFFEGPFVLNSLHGQNEIQVELSEEPRNKYPTVIVSLVKPYKSSDAEKFPFRNEVPHHIPLIESSGTRIFTKAVKERKLRTNKVR
ncbi:hypothetical protein O181_064252 [Austropuccinia psidii MF-1]|uniref:Uncharacterized protein n=1 Tax=Austropuccinia psidii MF-1 TaxID=1389203 RepID=A0A9Q3EVF1_9BASI|nr:hypothetical protein [Austropuccinia psidii MF-1]